MAEQLPPEAQASLIDRVASQQLGTAPPPPQAAPQQAAEKPTAQEQAVEDASPVTEGDKITEAAIVYEIDFDGEKRSLTPTQIKSTFDRYRDLNYKQAQNANVLKVIDAAIKAGIAKDPDDAARQILNALKAGQSNPQMGETAKQTNVGEDPGDAVDALAKWEEDNAVSLPPGYKESMGQMGQMAQMMQQMQQMMQVLGRQAAGAADSGVQQAVEAQQVKADAMRRTIANNLDRGAQKIGLAEDQASDFKMFAFERGYTDADFLDPGLTLQVMQDFKNASSTDELERLRQTAQRRQAFTGSLDPMPASGSAAEAPPAENATLGRLAERAMGQRM